ncbi:hypothetical protein AMJ85_00655 [candidate division BRC1 bacterium SM23_51]|nr:MAG: hypothetical protein AMJ85_00655 [candidate division BRC1 bacterium SM23_51]
MTARRRSRQPTTSAVTGILFLLLALWGAYPLGYEPRAQEAPAPVISSEVLEIADEETTVLQPVVIETTASAEVTGVGFLPVESAPMPLREIDESGPLNIFADPELVKKLLFGRVGRSPFQYDARGQPDPMIIPWVRVEILNTEHIAQAQIYLKEAEQLMEPDAKKKRYAMAIRELDSVTKMDPTGRYGKEAQALQKKIREMMDKIPPPGATPTPVVTKPPELPPWVVTNTKAVLYDQSPDHNHMILIGDDLLQLGDVVPKFPSVKIVDVNRDSVIYEFQGTRISVTMQVELKQE